MASCDARLTVEKRKSDGVMIASEMYSKYPLRLHSCGDNNNSTSSFLSSSSSNIIINDSYKMQQQQQQQQDFAAKSLSVFLLSHGGGLLAGDNISLNIKVKEGASLCATSFSTAKAFKPKVSYGSEAKSIENKWIRTSTTCGVEKNGLLALCPQPTQCFRGSYLEQKNKVTLDSDGTSSLLLVDWYTGGRANHDGGLWQMNLMHSSTDVLLANRNTINGDERLAFRDVTKLNGGEMLNRHMRGFNVVAMVLLIGPRVQTVIDKLLKACCARSKFELEDIAGDKMNKTDEGMNKNGLVVSCGPLTISKNIEDGMIVRLCSYSIEQTGTTCK